MPRLRLVPNGIPDFSTSSRDYPESSCLFDYPRNNLRQFTHSPRMNPGVLQAEPLKVDSDADYSPQIGVSSAKLVIAAIWKITAGLTAHSIATTPLVPRQLVGNRF